MPRSILIDTSLLVLLITGMTDPRLIERHKNLADYDADGFELLLEVLEEYSEVVLTPNTLTEASNLLRQIGSPDRERLMHTFRAYIAHNSERYVRSVDASTEIEFTRLGLTDAALMRVSRDQVALLSADHKLCLAVSGQGLDARNFAHLYEARFG